MKPFTNGIRKYLRTDTPKEIEQIHESLPRSGQGIERTMWERMLLVPQYITAWGYLCGYLYPLLWYIKDTWGAVGNSFCFWVLF